MRAAGRRPANRQCFKVPNSDLCLEVRPAAITEWELTTPSLERAHAIKTLATSESQTFMDVVVMVVIIVVV